MRRTCLLIAAFCAKSGLSWAGEAPNNVITVGPSAIQNRGPVLSAEERLTRRLKRSDQLLRSICIGCGGGDARVGSAPFSPLDALHARPAAPSQMLVTRQLPDEIIAIAPADPVDPAETAPSSPEPP